MQYNYDDSMNEIIVNPSIDKFCYIDDKDNMVDITDKVSKRLIELYKKFQIILGDDLVLDKSLTSEPIEDIYEYIVEKAYQTKEYVFEPTTFKEKPKKKLLIAFNKFFYNNIK